MVHVLSGCLDLLLKAIARSLPFRRRRRVEEHSYGAYRVGHHFYALALKIERNRNRANEKKRLNRKAR